MTAICTVCEMDEATPRCITCKKCRAYMHRWSNEKDGRIVEHFDKLRTRVRRMTTFAVVKDERVQQVSREELQKQRVMYFTKKQLKQRATATVVSIKVAEKLRKRA